MLFCRVVVGSCGGRLVVALRVVVGSCGGRVPCLHVRVSFEWQLYFLFVVAQCSFIGVSECVCMRS